ncbi:MAG: lytic transglycosylase domain-containing protein [Deltaproteobacteria bacterium]|nr:lytic transglycosylase domain-containing protein [Deltaproteobacteria bacterium]
MIKHSSYPQRTFFKKAVPAVFAAAVACLTGISSQAVLPAGMTDARRPAGIDDETVGIMGMMEGYSTGMTAPERLKLAGVIVEESVRRGIDPVFMVAIIKTESAFFSRARSTRGALGLMQIRTATARYLADELDIAWEGEATLYDPYTNVRMGIHYFSTLLDRYGADKAKALAAYSMGPSSLTERLKGAETVPTVYGDRVFLHYRNLKGRAGI